MKRNKGISLIVLVITIIVMIILAGSIILSLSNNGIINKANEAVDASNFKQLEQYISVELIANGWYEGKPITINDLQLIEQKNKDIKVTPLKSAGKDVPDTWLVEKAETKATVYATGEIVKDEVELWDGTSSAPEIKDGNWYIYTPSQLKFLADVVNGINQTEGYKITGDTTVYLMNNLDLGARQIDGKLQCGNAWTPIGITKPADEKSFLGTFEGNNHTIRGVYVSQQDKFAGIFGNSNTIQNLTIKDSYIKSADSSAGGIAGVLRTGDIINCHNINTEVTGKSNVGGIVGQIDSKNVKECTNTGNIFAGANENNDNTSFAGGIVGLTYIETVIENCKNYGDISASGNAVGGIVGNAWDKTTVKKCNNYGDVISELNGVGGIAGQLSKYGIIEKSINTAQVKGNEYIGGIVGLSNGCILVCYNQGEISGDKRLGGIAGDIAISDQENIVQNCYNKGKIITLNNNSTRIGGIVGYVRNDAIVEISNNYNIGVIETNGAEVTEIGGAIGHIELNTNKKASNNYYLQGVVTENGSYISGEVKTLGQMKMPAFVALLNTGLTTPAWEIRTGENNGYPVLVGLK